MYTCKRLNDEVVWANWRETTCQLVNGRYKNNGLVNKIQSTIFFTPRANTNHKGVGCVRWEFFLIIPLNLGFSYDCWLISQLCVGLFGFSCLVSGSHLVRVEPNRITDEFDLPPRQRLLQTNGSCSLPARKHAIDHRQRPYSGRHS